MQSNHYCDWRKSGNSLWDWICWGYKVMKGYNRGFMLNIKTSKCNFRVKYQNQNTNGVSVQTNRIWEYHYFIIWQFLYYSLLSLCIVLDWDTFLFNFLGSNYQKWSFCKCSDGMGCSCISSGLYKNKRKNFENHKWIICCNTMRRIWAL